VGGDAVIIIDILLNLKSNAPSTTLRVVPLPRLRGGG
jgi:hypothetical protein